MWNRQVQVLQDHVFQRPFLLEQTLAFRHDVQGIFCRIRARRWRMLRLPHGIQERVGFSAIGVEEHGQRAAYTALPYRNRFGIVLVVAVGIHHLRADLKTERIGAPTSIGADAAGIESRPPIRGDSDQSALTANS
ncbi:MAG: hypothetical protein BWY63_03244 [Chloroflexi bacterium ADurb.Bin360]|nr:MAG: hypothetical protein BWY63_03244 [Chloroflexi bacterium ADurb.Bin360]